MTKIDPDKKKQVAQYILKRLTLEGIHLSHIEFQKLLYTINQQYYYVWREFLFDNFIAEQYGPVEKDIYDEIKQNNKNLNKFNHLKIVVSQEENLKQLRGISLDILGEMIDNSLEELQNSKELTGKTHHYKAWQRAWKIKQNNPSLDSPLNLNDIKDNAIDNYSNKKGLDKSPLTQEEIDYINRLDDHDDIK